MYVFKSSWAAFPVPISLSILLFCGRPHTDSDAALISIDDKALLTTSSHEESTWIVHLGATTNMCHDKHSFVYLPVGESH